MRFQSNLFLMSFYFIDFTFCVFMALRERGLTLSTGVFVIFFPLGFSMFIVCILFPSYVTNRFRNRLINLFDESDSVNCSLRMHYKITHILEGMRHLDSFDSSSYIPNIGSAFIVWALPEMVSYVLLLL